MANAAVMGKTPFLWECTDRKGKKIKGKSMAANEAAVRADLRRQGVVPSKIRKQGRGLFKGGGTVTPADIAIFSRQLATMLAAGIPLVQAFEIVGAGHENAAMQKLIMAVKVDVEGGSALAEALGKHPLYFDDLFVNLVEAGEQAGALETLLEKIATYKEKTEAIKEETVSSNWAAENLGMYVTRPEEVAVRIFVYCLSGELDKAKDGVDELQEVMEESNRTGMLETSAVSGLFYRWQGDWDRAEGILKDTLEQGNRCQDLQLVAMSAQWLGELYLDAERYDEAAAELERSLGIYSEGDDLMGQVQVLPTLCRARTGAGELDQAQKALDSCLAITSAGEDWRGLNATVHLARAVYEAAKQNWEDAIDQFQQAVDVSEKYGLALHSAEVRLQWAAAHLARRWRG